MVFVVGEYILRVYLLEVFLMGILPEGLDRDDYIRLYGVPIIAYRCFE